MPDAEGNVLAADRRIGGETHDMIIVDGALVADLVPVSVVLVAAR